MDINNILASHALWLAGRGGERADLGRANLQGTDLREVSLYGASLQWADLRCADLEGADLRKVDFYEADLRGANLDRTNLQGADFWDVTGNGKEIKSLRCGGYPIAYTATHLQIGCEGHPIDDWWEFSDEEIDQMDPGESLEWWREWKPILQQIIEKSPAASTGAGTEAGE
jgi:uncharacterized protein YjbI with pentapeptide repeats